MTNRYAVEPGDTLAGIARKFYGESELHMRLAEYNGIRNADMIRAGQILEIPSRRELEGADQPPALSPAGLAPPNGLPAILDTFGNIFAFIREDGTLDPGWEKRQLGRAPLPFPIAVSWDLSQTVKAVQCHVRLTGTLAAVFKAIDERGLKESIRTYGGCFSFRSKRTSGKLSTHSWGIAIDLNPDSNPLGGSGDMDPAVVKVFREFGFKWGGDWAGRSKDPMHFQFCTGY